MFLFLSQVNSDDDVLFLKKKISFSSNSPSILVVVAVLVSWSLRSS